MSTLQTLVKPTRERSGSIASNRFSFQQNWSLCKLISMEQSGDDYVLIFEHDDDLMILDSEVDPKNIDFYQVKTKALGNWKISDLVKKGKKEVFSILGKMYSNKIKYEKQARSLNFISNAKFDIGLKSGRSSLTSSRICIVECESKEYIKISDSLKKEYTLSSDPDCSIIFLKSEDLALFDSGTHTVGVIATFLSSRDPTGKYNAKLIYNSFIDEIKRKSNYEHDVREFEELKKHKSISKQNFTAMLKAVDENEERRFEQIWQTASQRLNTEKEDVRVIEKIKRFGTEYDVKITDHADTVHKDLCKCVEEIVVKYLLQNDNKVTNLKEFLDQLLKEYRETVFNKKYPEIYLDEYIKAVILSKYYEK